jgi:hypothetical protein
MTGLQGSGTAVFTDRARVDSGQARRAALAGIVIVSLALLAGCAGGFTVGGPGSSGGGGGGGQAFTGNVCALLTSAELEQTTGEKFGAPTAGTGKCDWEMASGMGALSLEIKSPGGRQDFVETKQFLGLFQSGLNSLVAPVESQAGSFGLGGAIIGISGQPVPGCR